MHYPTHYVQPIIGPKSNNLNLAKQRSSMLYRTHRMLQQFYLGILIQDLNYNKVLRRRDLDYVHDFCPVDVENDKSVVYAGFLELSFTE